MEKIKSSLKKNKLMCICFYPAQCNHIGKDSTFDVKALFPVCFKYLLFITFDSSYFTQIEFLQNCAFWLKTPFFIFDKHWQRSYEVLFVLVIS